MGNVSTDRWTAAVSGVWSNAANWSLGHTPRPGNNVDIEATSPLTVTFDLANFAFGGLTLVGATLDLEGGALTACGPSSLRNAVVTGLKPLTLRGPAAISGLTVGGGVLLTNRSQATQSGGGVAIGDAKTSTACIYNVAGATWTIADASGMTSAGQPGWRFVNAGLFQKTSGSGIALISGELPVDRRDLLGERRRHRVRRQEDAAVGDLHRPRHDRLRPPRRRDPRRRPGDGLDLPDQSRRRRSRRDHDDVRRLDDHERAGRAVEFRGQFLAAARRGPVGGAGYRRHGPHRQDRGNGRQPRRRQCRRPRRCLCSDRHAGLRGRALRLPRKHCGSGNLRGRRRPIGTRSERVDDRGQLAARRRDHGA